MYDEVHYQEGPGPAKRLQLQHRAIPADLAVLVAAAFPDLSQQEAAGIGPPPADPPGWPWSEEAFRTRLAEARALLAERAEMAQFLGESRKDIEAGRTHPAVEALDRLAKRQEL
jgi:hypothetical protein